MARSKAELIVHPVRLRIIEAVQGHELTSRQIARQLPDVPQATLYRQVKALLDGGILCVVDERLVNGIVEKVYTMPSGAAHLTREEFARIDPADHRRYFTILMGGLSGKLGRYLRQDHYDVIAEGMTYFQAAPYLTDAEARQLRIDLLELAERYGSPRPAPGARRRTLGVALIPDGAANDTGDAEGKEEETE